MNNRATWLRTIVKWEKCVLENTWFGSIRRKFSDEILLFFTTENRLGDLRYTVNRFISAQSRNSTNRVEFSASLERGYFWNSVVPAHERIVLIKKKVQGVSKNCSHLLPSSVPVQSKSSPVGTEISFNPGYYTPPTHPPPPPPPPGKVDLSHF